MNGKQRIQTVLAGQKADRIPVFPLLMAFSARRIGASYRQFATDGSVLAQAQIHAFEHFSLDAITACSDAFRISADLGAEIRYPEEAPPYAVQPLIRSSDDLKTLIRPDPADRKTRMYDRASGVAEMVRHVGNQCMVLGWVDMPFAEICSLCGVQNVMLMLYDEPEFAHRLLEFITPVVCEFAALQIENGAEMIGCGDAAASLISPVLYREFVLPYEQRVCKAIHEKNAKVKLHICGNTTALLPDMTTSGADLFNIDHLVDFGDAADFYREKNLAWKGNLDPVGDILQATVDQVRNSVKRCIQMAEGTRFILSAGCEIPADTSDEVFCAFCQAVQE